MLKCPSCSDSSLSPVATLKETEPNGSDAEMLGGGPGGERGRRSPGWLSFQLPQVSSASGVVINPGSRLRGAWVNTMALREGVRLRRGGSGVRCRRAGSGQRAGDRRQYGDGVRRLFGFWVVERCLGSGDRGHCGRRCGETRWGRWCEGRRDRERRGLCIGVRIVGDLDGIRMGGAVFAEVVL